MPPRTRDAVPQAPCRAPHHLLHTQSGTATTPRTSSGPARLVGDWRGAAKWCLCRGAATVTHAHGDHFFGAPAVLDRFPQARLVAAADVAAHAAAQWGSAWFDGFWQPRFPDQISDRHLIPEPLPDGRIELEGEELRAIELGHTDTGTSPCGQHLADPGSVRAAGFRGKEAARPAPAEYAVHGFRAVRRGCSSPGRWLW
ncbi:MBL fold metallo-hydrolase [Streptomyces sp. 1222.5]|uniref:MBL fold metallo-hydrolase n=1 Tax=Streptomyces sp. 1222.5 TaxID=1881026 RepID=UPI003D706ABD